MPRGKPAVLRQDIAAYRAVPPTDEELAIAELAEAGRLDDGTDWATVYGAQWMDAATTSKVARAKSM